MARQFKRYFDLTIGVSGGDAISIGSNRVVFSVEKSIVGYPNLLQVSIYNLSQDTVKKISEEYNRINLYAGYINDSTIANKNDVLVFTGDLRNIFTVRQGADLVTVIYAGDGERTIQKSTYTGTFSAGTNMVDVFRKLGESLKDEFKDLAIGLIDVDGDKISSLSLNGSTKKILDELAEDMNVNWSIQDGEFQVVPRLGYLTGQYIPVVEINQNTGLINIPSLTEIGADCVSLLNANIKPNGVVRISSQTFNNNLSNLQFRDTRDRTLGNGIFRVNKVVHRGDSRGNDWYSEVTGQRKGIAIND